MDAMEAKMLEWRKKVPSKRQLTASLGKLVQQKSVAVLYTPSEQDRIRSLAELVTRATSDYERGEHWDRIMAVVDALSNTSNRAVLKESVHYLRLRLGDPSARVVILALTLTEAVVKNCGHLVHLEIATEGFMHELEALHKSHANKRGRDSLEIASRVLDLVQAWGEAFLPYRHDYPLFIDTYHNMRKKGVKFPEQYDETKVPVLTPPSEPAHRVDTSSISSSSSALARLSSSELYHVATNIVDMFEDMLHEVQKEQSSLSSHGVILELAQQARELVQRMEGVIQSAVTDGSESLESYLTVNDNLHTALKKYDELAANNQLDERRSATHSGSLTEGSNQNENGDNSGDDPFAEFVRARAGSTQSTSKRRASGGEALTPMALQSRSNQVDDADDDDPFASFVQQRAAKIFGSNADTPAVEEEAKKPVVEKNLIDLWDDEPVSNQTPQVPPSAQLKDLWLDDDDLLAPPQSSAAPHQPAATGAPVASQPLIDDLWGDAFVTPSPPPAIALASAAPPSNPDPFDFFSTPATPSAPTTRQPPSASPTNPFDLLSSSAPSSQFAPPPAQQQPPKSFNPFDF